MRARSASSDPWPSALMMRLSAFLPSAGICMNVSSETRCEPVAAMRTSRRRVLRFSAVSRATRSSLTTIIVSPAAGTSCKPITSTGIEGPAFLTCLPRSSMSARTLPNVPPTTMMSPTRSVPFWTSTVATAPRPRWSADSMTTPVARRFLLARSSRMSASSSTVSSKPSMPSPVLAETGTISILPPQSTGCRP